ncbi:adenylate/guanylate cyclase domain-containing protein [Hydrococcus rivularis NIES-593]|uniref:Adenylate/guanylate cyclase domain-containing protein n=1 Tax=Hydrococcus rivularis NIES-593 TaxID=1921803 RepID=A0A1U7HFN4_9CYAN|nr:adenylate/guanylate cyclase domain-containing protein [Hydrococcus rivularis NIES-593]
MENPGQNPYLLLQTTKGNRYLLLVGKTYWTIGRGKDNDFIISDNCISRNHAILQSMGTGEFFLIDLGSRNGTFVNGRRVSIPVTLRDRDRVTFGKTDVEFHCPSASYQTQSSRNNSDRETMTSVLHERRLMSVMVVDMRDFTVLTRQLNEEMLSSLIGNWFRQAGDIIRDAGSWVDKYIGDAIMAIWFHGHEEAKKEELLQIFQAASDLYKMTEELSAQYPLPFPLRIGTGINTGYAMVGNTGSDEHPDYTAIGDTVNAAFRLESTTKEIGLDIAIGETTYNYLSEFKEAQALFHQSEVTLKGYEKPTVTYGITYKDLELFLETNSITSA